MVRSTFVLVLLFLATIASGQVPGPRDAVATNRPVLVAGRRQRRHVGAHS